jgi:hypothetical protein
MQLSDMVDTIVFVNSRALVDNYDQVKLLAVEPLGIWVQSQKMTNDCLARLKKPSSSATLAFFLPYHTINYIVSATNELALSETSLGL